MFRAIIRALLISNSRITFNIAKTFVRDLTPSIELWFDVTFLNVHTADFCLANDKLDFKKFL